MDTKPLVGTDGKPPFDTESPLCPLRRCTIGDHHDVVGRGWDFEYHSTRESIDYLQCQSCCVVCPREIPSESALPIIYPSHYYSFAETKNPNRVVMAVRNWMARRKGHRYMSMVPSSNAQVVDIGCGDGRLLDTLRLSCPSGWSFYGIDWSVDAVERLRSKGYEGLSGDISRLDLTAWQNKFDLAVMHQLIEHVRDPRDVLLKVGGTLKSGGILSIETPDINSWDFRLLHKRYWSGYHIPRHFYIFNKKNFSSLARECGYEIVDTVSIVNPVAWIHSIKSYCADRRALRRFANFFNHQNVLMLALFTPLEILQTRFARTSSNMQINLRKL